MMPMTSRRATPAPVADSPDRACLCAADWEYAALNLMADKGVNAVGVEPLARRLGITKGSFYWHFSSRDELLHRALARWITEDEEIIARARRYDLPPRARLADFIRRTSRRNLTHRVYAALCACPDHPQVCRVLEQITRRRMDFLAEAFAEMGLGPRQARHRARLTYTAYLGFLQLEAQGLAPDRDSPDFDDYVEHAIEVLTGRVLEAVS